MKTKLPKYPKPLGNRILILLNPDEGSTSSGGILIPDEAQDKPFHGTVVGIGTGVYTKKGVRVVCDDIKVGSKVVVRRFDGVPIGQDRFLRVFEPENILAIV